MFFRRWSCLDRVFTPTRVLPVITLGLGIEIGRKLQPPPTGPSKTLIAAIHSNLDPRLYEGTDGLLVGRYQPTFQPAEFVEYVRSVEQDLSNGNDRVKAFGFSIVNFARYTRGDEFADQVGEILLKTRS